MNRIFTMLLLAMVASQAPAKPNNSPQSGRSFDGVEFPSVIAVPADETIQNRFRLTDVQKLLLHDPAKIGTKVFNSSKSAAILDRRLTYYISEDSSSSRTNSTGTSTETIHTAQKMKGTLDAEWFAIDFGNSDVAGIDLTGGVISRITLFYKNKADATRAVALSYPNGFEGSGWAMKRDGKGILLETEAMPELRYKEIPADPELVAAYRAIVNSKLAATRHIEIEQIPVVGDETSLLLVKAKPQEYVDKPFVVCGALSLSDYYNYGYSDAKPSHYSFSFYPLNANKEAGERVTFYLRRSSEEDLLNLLVHADKLSPRSGLLVRATITVSSTYVKTFDEAAQLYELLDWQFLDNKTQKWSPWHSQTKTTRVLADPSPTTQPQQPAAPGGTGNNGTVYTGPRGGQYKISPNGNKEYQKR